MIDEWQAELQIKSHLNGEDFSNVPLRNSPPVVMPYLTALYEADPSGTECKSEVMGGV